MKSKKFIWAYLIIGALIIVTIPIIVGGCANWERGMKDIHSNIGNGLNREIIVYDTVGNELYRQEGKFDIDYEGERVLYDDEKGLRHIIYFKNGTVIVNELEK